MRALFFVAAGVLGLAQGGTQPWTFNAASLYIAEPLRWERGSRPGQPPEELAVARVVILAPDSGFGSITCFLRKTGDGLLGIAYSEGYGISLGTWKRMDDKIGV